MALSRDPRQARGGQGPPTPQTAISQGWTGLNLSDDRLTVGDEELAWLENGMWLGRSIQTVPLFNGARGASLNPNSTIKESYGCNLTYGANTVPHPVGIFLFEDGSAWMRDFNNDVVVDTQIAAAGTFSASPNGSKITIWQDGPVLIIDDTAGYRKWSGTALTTIDATKKGHQLAVFEGHVWLLTAPRTITYTAPNTFDDFVAGDGAGSFKVTDDAFVGAVQGMLSTVEQLWIVGPAAIDALGNVATALGLTTFSITNALTTLGSTFPDSLIGYFRAVTFATGYSIHSLLGVTPQKLSGKIDRLFPFLSTAITFGPRAGVQMLNGALVLVFLYSFTPPGAGARTELLCFQEGRWFLATTPDLNANRVLDLITLTIHNSPEVYGIDAGGYVYRIFARSADAQKGTMTVSSRLFDFGAPQEGHQTIKIAADWSGPNGTGLVAVTLALTAEGQTVAVAGPSPTFLASVDSRMGLAYALMRREATILGQRIGWTITAPCSSGVALDSVQLEHAPTGPWETAQ